MTMKDELLIEDTHSVGDISYLEAGIQIHHIKLLSLKTQQLIHLIYQIIKSCVSDKLVLKLGILITPLLFYSANFLKEDLKQFILKGTKIK